MAINIRQQVSRRTFVSASASMAATSLLTGCCRFHPRPVPLCATASPLVPDVTLPLAIDIHTHVFNGTDLQVEKFIDLNASLPYDAELKKIVGEILQSLTWALAPTGCVEYRRLGHLASCTHSATLQSRVNADRRASYENGRSEIMSTPILRQYNSPTAQNRRANLAAVPDKRTQYLDLIATLLDQPVAEDFHLRAQYILQQRTLSASAADVVGLLRFILQGFKYRYVSVFDYLDTFSQGAKHSIDLMVANLVDYDWPLNGGRRTRTPMREQLAVMERLSIFTHGQVHAFVPFDPMREVAMAAGKHPETGKADHLSFQEIKDAVETRGFIGVKLYPPMGFLPTANASLEASTWAKPWLPTWMKESLSIDGVTKSFGAWMDTKLNDLYVWAVAKNVPITAHAEPSEGPDPIFDQFTYSDAWLRVLNEHKGLRVNFAHTGDLTANLADSTGSSPTQTYPPAATALLSFISGTGSADQYAYGDLSYAQGALNNPEALGPFLTALLKRPPLPGSAALCDRLLYGTDWLMVLQAQNEEHYLSYFESALDVVDNAIPNQLPKISDRIFALNAIRWLGLTPGKDAWTRLDAFYRRNGIDLTSEPPLWMTKVQRIIEAQPH